MFHPGDVSKISLANAFEKFLFQIICQPFHNERGNGLEVAVAETAGT